MKKFRKLASLMGGVLLVALAAYAVYAWFTVQKTSSDVVIDVGGPLYEREFITATTGDGFLPGESISFGSQIKHKNSGNRDVIALLDLSGEITVDAATGDVTGLYAKFDMAQLAANGFDADEIIAEFPDDYKLIGTDLYMKEERFENIFYFFMPVPNDGNWVRVKDSAGKDTGKYFLRVKAGDSIVDSEKILGISSDLGGNALLADGSRTPNRPFEQFVIVNYEKQVKSSQPSVKAFKAIFGEETYAAIEAEGYGFGSADSWFNFE
jgi:hypothetical protein